LESASLRDSQETQILLRPLGGERVRYLPLNREVAKGSLRSVIVPRHTIVVEKPKKRISVTNEPLYVTGGYLAPRRSVKNHSLVKALNGLLMLSQVPCFQTEALSVIQDRSQQIPEGAHKAFILGIERVLP
jgi:tRNA U54 and U55 pseudouridine synthase Pus10